MKRPIPVLSSEVTPEKSKDEDARPLLQQFLSTRVTMGSLEGPIMILPTRSMTSVPGATCLWVISSIE